MDLSDFFLTKAQATDFAMHLDHIVESVYKTNFNLEETLTHEFGIQKKDILMKLFRDNNMQNVATNQIQDFLKKIQEEALQIPVVLLTLAFEPTEEILKSFSQWFILNTKKHVAFEIKVMPSIIAGTTITFNGKFKDYSIRPLFDALVTQAPSPQTAKPVDTPSIHQSTQFVEIGR